MLWQENNPQKAPIISQSVIDMAFDIKCRCLPQEHAYALSQAISKALPWFEQEPQAGLHLIHGAESGNGWYRPDDELLYLSRRTKLILRLPQQRIAAAQTLTGMTLDIADYSLKIGKPKEKPLSKMPVLFARHIIADPEQDEDAFVDNAIAQLEQMDIQCHKALCGKSHYLKWRDGDLFVRSLMLADLKPLESMTLQQQGLGKGRKMGCGLFVAHKDIKALNPDAD